MPRLQTNRPKRIENRALSPDTVPYPCEISRCPNGAIAFRTRCRAHGGWWSSQAGSRAKKEKRVKRLAAHVEELKTSSELVSVTTELAAVKALLHRTLAQLDLADSSDDPEVRAKVTQAAPVFIEMAKTSVTMTRTAVDLAKELLALITVEQGVKLVIDAVKRARVEHQKDPTMLTKEREEELLERVMAQLVWPDVNDAGRQVSGQTLARLAPALPSARQHALNVSRKDIKKDSERPVVVIEAAEVPTSADVELGEEEKRAQAAADVLRETNGREGVPL